jgi:hypothetical protein
MPSGAGSYSGYSASPSGNAPNYAPGMGSSFPSTTDMASATPSPSMGGMGMSPPGAMSGPTLPSFDTTSGMQQITYYCSSCNREVPEHINDRCPHCGVRFDYVEQPDGTRKYNSHYVFGSVGTVIAVIIGIVIRLAVAARNS